VYVGVGVCVDVRVCVCVVLCVCFVFGRECVWYVWEYVNVCGCVC